MFGLSFLSPLFLLGAIAGAVPIVLHLFHRRAEPVVEFSAMRFLHQVPVEQARQRRWRELLLLALRVAAVVLLALVFARPLVGASAAVEVPRDTMVLVDVSASMSAPGQFNRARTLAEQAIREVPTGARVGLATFTRHADVIAPLSEDRTAPLAALPRVEVGAGATSYQDALAPLAAAFGGRPGRLVVVTDLQRSGWRDSGTREWPEGVAVDVLDVGAPEGNLGIAALAVERDSAAAVVRNFGGVDVATTVRFERDGRPVGEVNVHVPAGASTEARVSLTDRTGGHIAASVEDRVGYAVDNVRYAVLGAEGRPLVLVISASGHPTESLYVERALSVAAGDEGFRVRAVSAREVAAMPADDFDDARAVVIVGTRGLEERGRARLDAFVRTGGGLLITAGPDVDDAITTDTLRLMTRSGIRARAAAALRFMPEDIRHPVFRLFGGGGALAEASFSRTQLLEPAEPAIVIARFSDGTAALVEESVGRGRLMLFGSDLNNRWNDLPVQPAFVPFVHELLKHLSGATLRPSAYLVGDVAGTDGQRPGVMTVASRRVAVNVDPRESEPLRVAADVFREGRAGLAAPLAPPQVDAVYVEGRQRLWQYALIATLLFLVAEGLLARRMG